MASPKLDPLIPTPEPDQTHHPNYAVLPQRGSISHWTELLSLKNLYIICLLILAIGATIYALWPSKPHIKMDHLKVIHIKVHTRPHIAVDISLTTRVIVENKNLYSIDYTSLDVAVGYRGRVLGHVTSGGGHVMARGTSYVNATMEFKQVIVHDWIYLVDDLAKGLIRFDTFTQVDGLFGLMFFKIPFKVKLYCEIDVHTKNHTFNRQNCTYNKHQEFNNVIYFGRHLI